MIDLSDWEYYKDFDGYGAWYRLEKFQMEVPEGLEVTFKDGRPIVAAIFEQKSGSFICSCKSDDPELGYGEMDDFWVDDEDLEIIMLKMDIKLHGYGYRVVPGKKDVKKCNHLY